MEMARMEMETVSEILEAAEQLNSQEGTIQFLMEQTFFSRERVERIHRLGEPWPLSLPEGWEHEEAAMVAVLRGVPSPEGTDPLVTLNALNQLRDWDDEEKERKSAAHKAAVERGETPESIPESKGDSKVDDHLEKVANLSGESMETITKIYNAHMAQCLQMKQLARKMNELKAKEGRK